MIQLLFTVLGAEAGLVVLLLFQTPLQRAALAGLDRLKRRRGPVMVKTVAATALLVVSSSAYSMLKIRRRSSEIGQLTPTDQVLFARHLLEASLMGQKLSGIAGSPAYVAPEVLSGDYSEKVDIWGAGVLLHALLAGALPFQGGSLEAVFESIKNVELDFHSGVWDSVSELARDLISRMLTRDVSSRITASEALSHPWILFYTECPLKAVPNSRLRVTNRTLAPRRIEWERVRVEIDSSSSETSSQKSDEQDECGFVDALAAAISRVRISEPKRSRLCSPAIPVQQECSSNLKANLCTAF